MAKAGRRWVYRPLRERRTRRDVPKPPVVPVDLALAALGCARNGMSVVETAALLGVSVERARGLVAAGRRREHGGGEGRD